jgi:hypothetical protein
LNVKHLGRRVSDIPRGMGRSHGKHVLTGATALLLVAMAAACSPEAARTREAGLGADPGNSRLPIELHGDRTKNNPSFEVPARGKVPENSHGVSGWWGQ